MKYKVNILVIGLCIAATTHLVSNAEEKKDAKSASEAKIMINAELALQASRGYWKTLLKAERAIASLDFDPLWDDGALYFGNLVDDKEPHAKILKIEHDLIKLRDLIKKALEDHPNAFSQEDKKAWEVSCTEYANTLKNSGIKIYAARKIAQQLLSAGAQKQDSLNTRNFSASAHEEAALNFTKNTAKNIRILKKMIPHLPKGITEIERCKSYYPELVDEAAALQTQFRYYGPPYLYMPPMQTMHPMFTQAY